MFRLRLKTTNVFNLHNDGMSTLTYQFNNLDLATKQQQISQSGKKTWRSSALTHLSLRSSPSVTSAPFSNIPAALTRYCPGGIISKEQRRGF